MADIERARQALEKRLLEGAASVPATLRRAAFEGRDPGPLWTRLLEKLSRNTHDVTDDDFRAVKAGASEDDVFEMVICAAAGQATRDYELALAALDAAENE